MSAQKEVIEALTYTHRIMERVLTLIRFQVCGLQPSTDAAGYTFLKNAIGYMHHFPGLSHHPAEELLFARLVLYAPDSCTLCKRLTEQHRTFAQWESRLLRCIGSAETGNFEDCGHIEQLGCAYCVEHADHIGSEEAEIFPQAAQWLPATDWDAIDLQAPQVSDPLAERNTFKSYDSLYDYLMAAGERFSFH